MLIQLYDAKIVYQNQIPNTFKNIMKSKRLLMQSIPQREENKNNLRSYKKSLHY